MTKRIIKIILALSIPIVLLIGASYAISNYRLNRYHNSVVNDEEFSYKEINQLFKKTNSDTIYVFLYDKESDDAVYLDEVLLKEISYEHNGIIFEDIYKVVYEQSYRSYINQMIKNTYQVESFPAIITLTKTEDGFEKKDSFEYSTDQNENIKNLNRYLEDNGFFNISKKD